MRSVALVACFLALAGPCAAAQAVSIDARDTDLAEVIRLIALESGQNIVADGSVKARKVTFRLRNVDGNLALAALAQAFNLRTRRIRDVVFVGTTDTADLAATSETAVLRLERARAEDIAPILAATLPAGSVAVPDKRGSTVVVRADAPSMSNVRRLVAALDVPAYGHDGTTEMTTLPLRNAKASDALRALKTVLPEVIVVSDDRSNAVVVVGRREALAAAGSLVERFDRPGRQVLFEVRVTDIRPIDESSNVGFQLGGLGFGSGALGQFPYTLVRSSIAVNAQLDALVQNGHGQILATPRIATLNNHEASLLVGETYPIVTVNQQTGYPTVSNVDIGVALRVTPTIGDDGTITAELHPSYSAISGFNNGFPIVANRKVDSTLRVRDGETIVLGGLFEETSSETIARLPFLSQIPVLGQFFRHRATTHERDEVVFLITPHILDGPRAEPRPTTSTEPGTLIRK